MAAGIDDRRYCHREAEAPQMPAKSTAMVIASLDNKEAPFSIDCIRTEKRPKGKSVPGLIDPGDCPGEIC
jgi:hypothetical protein